MDTTSSSSTTLVYTNIGGNPASSRVNGQEDDQGYSEREGSVEQDEVQDEVQENQIVDGGEHVDEASVDMDNFQDAEMGIEDPEPEINQEETEEGIVQEQERRYPSRDRRPPRPFWDLTAWMAVAEPESYQEAIEGDQSLEWKRSMEEEMESLRKNSTWTLVPLPKGRKAVTCKWVLKIKYDQHGEVDRYKSRLVARGFTQKEGIDYDETFAPVAKFTSIRALLALAAERDMDLQQMDVKTAFLNGELEEEVYMTQPEGFIEVGKEHLVCKLQKSLYGLKQAPRAWNTLIDGFLKEKGFVQSMADHCIYTRLEGASTVIIALYVDDLIIASNSDEKMKWTKDFLNQRFEMKDLGPLSYCLGIQIRRDRTNRILWMSQEKYISDVLKRFNMSDCRPVATPLEPGVRLTKDMGPATQKEMEDMRKVPYRSAVGSLMYAMVGTRPDIATAVGVVSRHLENPGQAHWSAVKRIFRYLRGTTGVGICYGTSKNLGVLEGYSDADWAGDLDSRRSTTGYVFTLGGGAISWNSKRQATVALSTTEAEYMALSSATQEAIWLRSLLKDLDALQQQPTVIYEDNQACIAVVKNPTCHSRMKHIEIRHHFTREKVEAHEVVLQYLETSKMAADILTKAIAKPKFEELRDLMGLRVIKGREGVETCRFSDAPETLSGLQLDNGMAWGVADCIRDIIS